MRTIDGIVSLQMGVGSLAYHLLVGGPQAVRSIMSRSKTTNYPHPPPTRFATPALLVPLDFFSPVRVFPTFTKDFPNS
jgi:hypothetical protein